MHNQVTSPAAHNYPNVSDLRFYHPPPCPPRQDKDKDKSQDEAIWWKHASAPQGPCEYSVNIRLRSEGRSEAGDRRAMAQDCTRSCSGRTGSCRRGGSPRLWP
eukprot:scaffold6453_cov61-Phaeocystis_antarctica.AAC.3